MENKENSVQQNNSSAMLTERRERPAPTGRQRVERVAGRWGLDPTAAMEIVQAVEEQQTVPSVRRRKRSIVSVAQRWRLTVSDALDICKAFEEQQTPVEVEEEEEEESTLKSRKSEKKRIKRATKSIKGTPSTTN